MQNPHAEVATHTALLKTGDDGDVAFRLRRLDEHDTALGISQLAIHVNGRSATLSTIMPILHSMNLDVLDERPTRIVGDDGARGWLYEFRVRFAVEIPPDGAFDALAESVAATLHAMWSGRVEVDPFNALVVSASLSWREANLLRAYARYLRQVSIPFSQNYIAAILDENPPIVQGLVELFVARFDPGSAATEADVGRSVGRLRVAIDAVAHPDADRILRGYLALIMGTVRTNYFVRDAGALALKLAPESIDEVPRPRPLSEIFVYSRRVEGLHMRFGRVARGGLRHSERPEDYRTEILGLARAQSVKNAVIVPAGAKGGFVVKDPERHVDEARDCYRTFVGALLDVVDDVDSASRSVTARRDVVAHDGEDTYLVVAADKGTATYSDVANEIALERGFWLGDAFASGGSVGYDHKAMGITARGAWASVTHHFHELGHDVMNAPTTVVGVGDMSGDVFGNGMLLSRHLRLIAAFDHRHVFIDPDPDAGRSFAERARLFALPGSSWGDYDRGALSSGAMIVPRTAKRVTTSAEARSALGLDATATELTPAELISAILCAPADLLWNGGIGTYVKASDETDADARDKANDAIRVDAGRLRVRVVGEGGNLGFTPRGRIEYARRGGRINSDAVDNSAGVDCSDHEVNIKIVLDRAIRDGELDVAQRACVLHDMADDVADLVIADNRLQNELLSAEHDAAATELPVHARLIRRLEATRVLDRDAEALPSDEDLAAMGAESTGLSRPELATVLAHTKLAIKTAILNSTLPETKYVGALLRDYFPTCMGEVFGRQIAEHPLRREIIATVIANDVVNSAGLTYAMRMADETGADTIDVIRAYLVTVEVFGIDEWRRRISRAASDSPVAAVVELRAEISALLERATRWFLTARPQPIAMSAEMVRYRDGVRRAARKIPSWLGDADADEVRGKIRRFVELGMPADVARDAGCLLDSFSLLNVVDAAELAKTDDIAAVARVYFMLSARLRIGHLLAAVTALDSHGTWDELARLSLRDDLHATLLALCLDALTATSSIDAPEERVEEWFSLNRFRIDRANVLLESVNASAISVSSLTVASQQVRHMVGAPGARGPVQRS